MFNVGFIILENGKRKQIAWSWSD